MTRSPGRVPSRRNSRAARASSRSPRKPPSPPCTPVAPQGALPPVGRPSSAIAASSGRKRGTAGPGRAARSRESRRLRPSSLKPPRFPHDDDIRRRGRGAALLALFARSSRSCGRTLPRCPLAGRTHRARPADRCRHAPFRDGGGLRWQRRRRRLGLEERLRRLRGRGRPVPAPVRRRDGRARRDARRPAGDAGQGRRPAAEPYAALGGERDLPAVLHAAPPGVRGGHCGHDYAGRSGAGAVSRHRAACHLRRACRRLARVESSSPRRARACSAISSRISASRASTQAGSTTISIPASRPP